MHTDQSLTAPATPSPLSVRESPLEMSGDEFRRLGHQLVDRIAIFLDGQRERPVAPNASPAAIRALLGDDRLPMAGSDAAALLEEAASLLFEHSTFNGHPRFFGYITSSAAPIGALGDLLAATVNPNVGAWSLSPMATEIERQAVRWVAELIGFPRTAGGLFVSGGNMANMVCFMAARAARAGWDVRPGGVAAGPGRLVLYTSKATHTWVQKAADFCGLGTDAIRWIETDDRERMRVGELRARIREDRDAGHVPFLVVGTGGSVSTGVIDPLAEIGAICREEGLWHHVDGAYGAPAAMLPDAPADLIALADADSVAVDPHKWLYVPLEAGCALVRDAESLRNAFSYRPPYYHFDGADEDPQTNFYEWGPQNSRGFRALKVWLAIRQAGREGFVRMIGDDIALAGVLFEHAAAHPELEALTLGLSIATFRYIPAELRGMPDRDESYLNALNEALLSRLQQEGQVYLSNAVLGGRFYLRACVVNFRTTAKDMAELPAIIARTGRAVHERMRAGG